MAMTVDEVKRIIEKKVSNGNLYETTFADSLSDILKESSYLLYGFEDSTEECKYDSTSDHTYTKDVSPLYYSRVVDNADNKELLDIILSEVPYYHITPDAEASIFESSLSETRDAGIDNVPSIMHENDFYQTWFRNAYGYVQNEILLDVYNKLRYPYINENQYLDANIFANLAESAFNLSEDSESKISFDNDDEYLNDIIDQKVVSNYSYIDYSSEQSDFLSNVIESYYQSGQFNENQQYAERLVFKLQEVKNELLRRKLSGTYTIYKLALATMNRNGSYVGVAKASDITPYDSFIFNGEGNVVAVSKSVNEERPVRIVNVPGITTATIDSIDSTIDPIATYYIAPDEYDKMPLKLLNAIFYTSAEVKDAYGWSNTHPFNNEKFYTLGSVDFNDRMSYSKENFNKRAEYDSYFLRDNANIILWTALEGVTSQQNIAEYPDTLDMYEEKNGKVVSRTLDSYITSDNDKEQILWHLDNNTSMVSLKSVYSNALDINADRPLYHKNSLQKEVGSYYDYLTYPIADGNGVCLMDSFWLNYLEYQLSSKTKVNDTTLYGVQINRFVDLEKKNCVEYDFFGYIYNESENAVDLYYCTIVYDANSFKTVSTDINKRLISRIFLHRYAPEGFVEKNGSLKSEYADCEPFVKYNIGVLPFTYKNLVNEKVENLKLGFYKDASGKDVFYDDAATQGYAKAMFVFSEYDVTCSVDGKDADPAGSSINDSVFTNDYSRDIRSIYYVVKKTSKEEYINVTNETGSPVYDSNGNIATSAYKEVYKWSDPIRVIDLKDFIIKEGTSFVPDWYGLAYHLNPYLNFTTNSASALRHKSVLKANVATQILYNKLNAEGTVENLPVVEGPSSQAALSNLARMRRLDFTANDLGEYPTNWTSRDSDIDEGHPSKNVHGMYLKKIQAPTKGFSDYRLASDIYGDNRDDDLYDLPYSNVEYVPSKENISNPEGGKLYIWPSKDLQSKEYNVYSFDRWVSIDVEETRSHSNIHYNSRLKVPTISIQQDNTASDNVINNYLEILPSRNFSKENYGNWYWNSNPADGMTVCINFFPEEYHIYEQATGNFQASKTYYKQNIDGFYKEYSLTDYDGLITTDVYTFQPASASGIDTVNLGNKYFYYSTPDSSYVLLEKGESTKDKNAIWTIDDPTTAKDGIFDRNTTYYEKTYRQTNDFVVGEPIYIYKKDENGRVLDHDYFNSSDSYIRIDTSTNKLEAEYKPDSSLYYAAIPIYYEKDANGSFIQSNGFFKEGKTYYLWSGYKQYVVRDEVNTSIKSGFFVKNEISDKVIIKREDDFSIEVIDANNQKDECKIKFTYCPLGNVGSEFSIESEPISLKDFASHNHRLSASVTYLIDGDTAIPKIAVVLDDKKVAGNSDRRVSLANKADNKANGILLFTDLESDRQSHMFYGDILDLRLYRKGFSDEQLRLLNMGMLRELYSYGPSPYKLAQTVYKDPGIFKIVDNNADNDDIKHIGAVRIFNRSVWDSILIDNFPVSEEEMDPNSPQYYKFYKNPKYDTDVYLINGTSEAQLNDCVEQTLLDRVEVLNGREIKQSTVLHYNDKDYTLDSDTKASIVLATVSPISYADMSINTKNPPAYKFDLSSGVINQSGSDISFFLKEDASDDYFKYSADFSPNFTMDDSFNLASWLTRGSNISLVYDKTKNDSYAVLADDSIRSSESNCIVVPLMIPSDKNLEGAYLDRLNISNFRLSGEFSRLLKATSYYSELRIPMACKHYVKDKAPVKLTVNESIPKYFVDVFYPEDSKTYAEGRTYYFRYGFGTYDSPYYYEIMDPQPSVGASTVENAVFISPEGTKIQADGLFTHRRYYTSTDGVNYTEYTGFVIGDEIPAYYEKDANGSYSFTKDNKVLPDKTYYSNQLVYKSGYYNKWDGIRALKEGTYYFTCKYPIRLMPFNDNEFDASVKGSLATLYASTRFKIEVSSSAKELTDDETEKYSINNMPSKYNANNVVDTLKSSNELVDPEDNRTFPHREVSIKLYALDVPADKLAGYMMLNGSSYNEDYSFKWKLIASNDSRDGVVLLDKETVEKGCLITTEVPMFFSKNFTMPFFIAGQVKVEDDENFTTDSTSADDDLIEPIEISLDSSREKIAASSTDDTDHLVLIAGKTYKILFDYTAKVSEFAYTNEKFGADAFDKEKLICSRYYSLIDSLGVLDSDFAYTTDGDSFRVPENLLDASMGACVMPDGTFASKSDAVTGDNIYYIGDPLARTASRNALYGWLYPQNSTSARYNLENSYKIYYLSQFSDEVVSLNPTSNTDKPIARLRIEDFKAFDSNYNDVTVHGFSENAILKQQYMNMIDVDSLMEIQSTASGLISGFSKVKPYIHQSGKASTSYVEAITKKSHELYAYSASSRTMPCTGTYSITRTSLFRNNLLKGKQLDYLNDKYWTVTGIYDEASYVDDEDFGKAVVKITNVRSIDLYYDGGEYLLNSKYEAAINLKSDDLVGVSVKVYYYDNSYNELKTIDLNCGANDKSNSIWNYHAQLDSPISASKVRFNIIVANDGKDILIGKAIVRGNGTSTTKVGLASTYYGGLNADGNIVVSSHSIPVLKNVSTDQYLPIQFKNRAINAYSEPRPDSGINRAAAFISENKSGGYGSRSKVDKLELPWVRRFYYEKGNESSNATAYFHRYDINKDLFGHSSYDETYKVYNDIFKFEDPSHPENSVSAVRDEENADYMKLTINSIKVDLDADGTLSYYGNNLKLMDSNPITMDNERLGLTYNCFNIDSVREGSNSIVAVTNIQLLNNLIEDASGTMDDREVLYELEYLPIIYDESKHHLSMNIFIKR